MIPPMDVAILEAALVASQESKLLCESIVQKAATALRDLRRSMQATRHPAEPRKHTEPRGHAEPRGRPDPKMHGGPRDYPEATRTRPPPRGNSDPSIYPDNVRGPPDARVYADVRGPPQARGPPDARGRSDGRGHPEPRGRPDGRGHPEPRGHPEARGQLDTRGQRADSRQRAETHPRAEPQQQRYIPQQPQFDQARRHAPSTETHTGRPVKPEHAEAPSNKHPLRGQANIANPPRKGQAARNQGAAAANAAPPQGHPNSSTVPAVNNAAPPQASQAPAAKPAAVQESDDCVVCWANEKDVVCVPCGHVAMCKSCSKAVMQQSGLCPVCRCAVREIIQVFKT